jgi:hypothetical protein
MSRKHIDITQCGAWRRREIWRLRKREAWKAVKKATKVMQEANAQFERFDDLLKDRIDGWDPARFHRAVVKRLKKAGLLRSWHSRKKIRKGE